MQRPKCNVAQLYDWTIKLLLLLPLVARTIFDVTFDLVVATDRRRTGSTRPVQAAVALIGFTVRETTRDAVEIVHQ